MAHARWRNVTWIAAALVVLAAGVVGAFWWTGQRPAAEPFVLHAQVPTSAEQIIWLDELGDVVDGLSDLGRQIRGAEGLSEAGALLIGMPRLDRATLSEVGLDPSAGVVVWQHERALWISTRVANDGGAATSCSL